MIFLYTEFIQSHSGEILGKKRRNKNVIPLVFEHYSNGITSMKRCFCNELIINGLQRCLGSINVKVQILMN